MAKPGVLLRKAVFFVHLWVGLVVGLWFVFLGLSGSVLTFKDELNKAANASLLHVAASGSRLPLQRLVDGTLAAYPGARLGMATLPQAADDALVVGFSRSMGDPEHQGPIERLANRREAFVDPYTGRILGDRPAGGLLLSTVRGLHEDLLLEDVGRFVGRWGVLLLIALLITGVWLWWPSAKAFSKQLKQRITVKRGATYRRKLYDLHNVAGFYSGLFLLLLATTAATHYWRDSSRAIVYTLTNTVMAHEGDGGPGGFRGGRGGRRGGFRREDAPSAPLNLDGAVAKASQAFPDLTVLQIGNGRGRGGGGGSLRVVKGHPGDHGVSPLELTLEVDPRSGDIRNVQSNRNLPLGVQIMNWAMPVHYGQWGPGASYYVVKAVQSAVGLMPLALYVTGLLKWWDRRKEKVRNAKRKRAASGSPLSSGGEGPGVRGTESAETRSEDREAEPV